MSSSVLVSSEAERRAPCTYSANRTPRKSLADSRTPHRQTHPDHLRNDPWKERRGLSGDPDITVQSHLSVNADNSARECKNTSRGK